MTYARIENKKIVRTIERLTSDDPVWVEEDVYEDVEQFRDGKSIGTRPEKTGKKHIVPTTVSVPEGFEPSDEQMAAWGYTKVEEVGRSDDRPQFPKPIEMKNGSPVRQWGNVTDIVTDKTEITAGGEYATVRLRLGDDMEWPDIVAVDVNGLAGEEPVPSSGIVTIEVGAETRGPVDITIHDQSISIFAREAEQ